MKVDPAHRKTSGHIVASFNAHVDSSSSKDNEFVERGVGKLPTTITVCSHKKAKKDRRSDIKYNEIQRLEYIIEAQKAEIRMYRKRIDELNNGASAVLLLGESVNKTLNENKERGRIIVDKIGIADDNRTDKEVK